MSKRVASGARSSQTGAESTHASAQAPGVRSRHSVPGHQRLGWHVVRWCGRWSCQPAATTADGRLPLDWPPVSTLEVAPAPSSHLAKHAPPGLPFSRRANGIRAERASDSGGSTRALTGYQTSSGTSTASPGHSSRYQDRKSSPEWLSVAAQTMSPGCPLAPIRRPSRVYRKQIIVRDARSSTYARRSQRYPSESGYSGSRSQYSTQASSRMLKLSQGNSSSRRPLRHRTINCR